MAAGGGRWKELEGLPSPQTANHEYWNGFISACCPLHCYTYVTVCGLHGEVKNKKMPDFTQKRRLPYRKSCTSQIHLAKVCTEHFGVALDQCYTKSQMHQMKMLQSIVMLELQACRCVQLDKGSGLETPTWIGQPCFERKMR